MSAPSTSGLSVELLLRVIDVKYGCFALFNGGKIHSGIHITWKLKRLLVLRLSQYTESRFNRSINESEIKGYLVTRRERKQD